MKKQIEALMHDKEISFNVLHSHFNMSKQTLTQKLNGTLDWTFPELMVLCQVFELESPEILFKKDE
jgi:hypothetical protein